MMQLTSGNFVGYAKVRKSDEFSRSLRLQKYQSSQGFLVQCSTNINGECNRKIHTFCIDQGFDGAVNVRTTHSDLDEILSYIASERG